jgi:hypothetical protein
MRNIKQVNQILKRLQDDKGLKTSVEIELVKGDGYFYFVSPSMQIRSIYCNNINAVTESDLEDAINQEILAVYDFEELEVKYASLLARVAIEELGLPVPTRIEEARSVLLQAHSHQQGKLTKLLDVPWNDLGIFKKALAEIQ